jgi:hypothetical protein
MAASIYHDKLHEPNDKMLSTDLGETKQYFDQIGIFIKNKYGNLRSEWKFYNQKSGWILKMFNNKRNVMFIVPCEKYFRTAFTFGEKATLAIHESEISDNVKRDLSEAKKYAEGRTIQIEIRNAADLDMIMKLIRIKLSF